MCTAIYDNKCGVVLGRTLDLEGSYGEEFTVSERHSVREYLHLGKVESKYKVGGMAHTVGEVPLFYDAMNECGMAMAALNFPRCAVYLPPHSGYINLGSFELIPYILGQCADLTEAEECLLSVNLTTDAFADGYPVTPLHFIIADKDRTLVIEPREDGLSFYDTPVGIMTNSPSYDYHLTRLSDYHFLTNRHPPRGEPHSPYSRGMGGIGIPGDWSSSSRFVRADFVKRYIAPSPDPVSRFFHIADAVEVPRGCVLTESGDDVYTVYTSCMDLEGLSYNYRTYDDRAVRVFKL